MASFGLTCTCGNHHKGDLSKRENKDVIHCACGAVWTLKRTHESANTFSPYDEVTHIDYPDYGLGKIKEISASGKRVRVEFPNYDQKKYVYTPKGYYSPEKLVKVPNKAEVK